MSTQSAGRRRRSRFREVWFRICRSAAILVLLGAALTTTVKRFNEAVGSVSARLLPSLQRARELGVSSRELPELPEVEVTARELPELPQITPRALEDEGGTDDIR